MNFVRNWVLHNWGWKLVALLLSFLLWSAYTDEPTAEAGYTVPIIFRNVPAGSDLSGEEPTQAHVVLRGRTQLLRRIQPSDLAIHVDLAGAQPAAAGQRLVPLTGEQMDTPLGTELARITPAEIRVRLVPRGPRGTL